MKHILLQFWAKISFSPKKADRVDEAAGFIAREYGETFDLLAKYDKGEITSPKSVAKSGDVRTTVHSIRQVLR